MTAIMIQPWQPLKWKPAYDLMISMHCYGYSNVEIARQLEYSPVQVGNILRSDEAKTVIKRVRTEYLNQISEDVPTQIEELKAKSFMAISNALSNADLAEKAPLAVASMGINFLKGIGSLSDGASKGTQVNLNIPVPAGQFADMITALQESNALNADRARVSVTPKQLAEPEADYIIEEPSGSGIQTPERDSMERVKTQS